MDKKLYLAYGSNLNVEQMKYRCPDAEIIGATVLKDYKLTFRGNHRYFGVANIEPSKGDLVSAGIWSISRSDERALDRYEGYPTLYTKVDVVVEVNGKKCAVMAYVMTGNPKYALPSRDYFFTIYDGFGDFGLDKRLLVSAFEETKIEIKGK